MTFYAGTLTSELARAEQGYRDRTPQSATAQARAARVMPGGNTRSSLWAAPYPLSITSGSGCRITDADGHEYVDFLGEFTAGIFGHTCPALERALTEAHRGGFGLSSHTPYEADLAEELAARFPSIDLLRFANSGTEANLMALTAARLVTGRDRIVVFAGGYHGGVLTFGAGNAPVNIPFEFAVLPYNDLQAVAQEFAAAGDRIAAVLVEPMQGAGGCVVGTPAFLQGLRTLCDDSGALLIFDEVQTARMAPGGAQERLGITPDMTTLGKIFGGGLAFGAFGGKAEVMARFDPSHPEAIPHAGTFNNNRLTMAAGLEAVRHHLTPGALEALFERGEVFREALNARFSAQGGAFHVTGMGSIMNIHAVAEDPAVRRDRLRLLHFHMMERGYYFAARGLIALSFPLGEAERADFLDTLDTVLAAGRASSEF
ncbi:aspartate aminotransferase family protein [Pseudodonghicola xiamenensis]|uniref:Glutamate-1-semialdehyde 2,1-aminomutase n=1 Tax=Pseudodonghicola xiamenensis TaxID=337702 RepID=A0A8J3MFW3_9RHOB|nr:aminotransferase class III-fold pyridoxal phosphate-dependent enzyme [Pseudodonghicola xiamenensis]GHG97236.1 glutamate-1-semialdehyde 2,1-aminomutase [Pseudodonghicola xiamenensis]